MGFWPLVNAVLRQADIIVLVGDSRMPELSRNPELERKVSQMGKTFVYVYTKRDLVSDEALKKLKKQYSDCFFVAGPKNIGINDLRRHLIILSRKIGVEEPVIGVVGYPNVGKSALINVLARSAKTDVADRPGTTRGIQWIKAGSLKILDSPGVIPLEDRSSKLALIGSKHSSDLSNPERVALEIINIFLGASKDKLEERYGIEIKALTSANDVLEEIGKKRGFLKKGGEVDEKKTAIYIVQEWQKGKLKI